MARTTPENCHFPLGDLQPHHMVPWAHSSLHPKRHVDRFSRFCTTYRWVFHYFKMGRYVFAPKLPPSPWGSGCPSNTWYLGPTRVINPDWHLDRFSRFSMGLLSDIVISPAGAVAKYCNEDANELSMGRNPQNCPFHWDFGTPPKKDRATAIGNMHKILVKIARVVQEICSRTDRHTHSHTRACSLQYFATAPAVEITRSLSRPRSYTTTRQATGPITITIPYLLSPNI